MGEHGQPDQVAELFNLLDSTKPDAVAEAKSILHENLNSSKFSDIRFVVDFSNIQMFFFFTDL